MKWHLKERNSVVHEKYFSERTAVSYFVLPKIVPHTLRLLSFVLLTAKSEKKVYREKISFFRHSARIVNI
jgi:hypothetical protein